MRFFLKLIAGIGGGLMASILAALVFSLPVAGAEAMESANQTGLAVGALTGLTLALTAPRPAKAWRRVFAACGLLAFAMPVSAFIFTYLSAADAGERMGNAGAAGAMLGGGMATFGIGFVAFFVGLIFFSLAYFIGKDD